MVKKYIAIAAILFATASVVVSVWAGMDCLENGNLNERNINAFTLNLDCTANTAPATSVYTLTSTTMNKIGGRFLHSMYLIPGSPGPSNNSDLQIKDSRDTVIVSATDNGKDKIDTSTVNGPIFGLGAQGSSIHKTMLHSDYPLTITVTGNTVNNSIFTLSTETTF